MTSAFCHLAIYGLNVDNFPKSPQSYGVTTVLLDSDFTIPLVRKLRLVGSVDMLESTWPRYSCDIA